MEHKIMHRSYRRTIGEFAVPENRLINDLGENAIYYIGSFSEFNPIGYKDGIAVYVRKNTTKSINQQKPFKLKGFKLQYGLRYHGHEFNNNSAISFSKQDLLRMANAMDETDEGKFSIYDVSDNIRGRVNMFTVFEDKNGWIVRNAFVPDELQRKGIASKFYIEMNQKSKQKTGKNLRSTQPRMLSNGEIVHELSKDGISLWDSFVNRGLVKKISEKNYIFI